MIHLILISLGCSKQLQADLAACQSDLADCNNDLSACQSDLADCQAELDQAELLIELLTAEGELEVSLGPKSCDSMTSGCTDDQLMPGTVEFQAPDETTCSPSTVLTWYDANLSLKWKEIWYVLNEDSGSDCSNPPDQNTTHQAYVDAFKDAGEDARLDWIDDCGGVACSELPASKFQEAAVMKFNYLAFPDDDYIDNAPDSLPAGATNSTFDVYNLADGVAQRTTEEPTGVLYRERWANGKEHDYWMLFEGDVEDDGDDNTFYAAGDTWDVEVVPRATSYTDLHDYLDAMRTLRASSDPTTGWEYVPIHYEWK